MENSEENNKELTELLAQLSLPEQEARNIAEDIQVGDDLFSRYDQASVPGALLKRIEETTAARLAQHQGRRNYARARNISRIAAVIAVAALLVLLVQTDRNHSLPSDSGQDQQAVIRQTGAFEDDNDLWELALTLGDSVEDQIDDYALAEMSWLWDESDTQIEDLLGKEPSDEKNTEHVGGAAGIWHT